MHKRLLASLGLLIAISLPAAALTLFKFHQSFVSQTGTSTTTLFTPTVTRDYQVSISVENFTGTGTVCSSLGYTDDLGSVSPDFGGNGPHTACGSSRAEVVFTVHGVSGQSVTLGSTDFGNGQTYSAFVTVIAFP